MSIRTRLTLWYGAIMALLLISFGATLYTILRENLLTSVDRTLVDTAEEIQASARREVTLRFPFNWEEVVTLPPLDVFAASDVFVQVRLPDGAVAVTSANLRGETLPALPPEAWEQVRDRREDMRTVEMGGTRLRLRSEPIVSQGQLVGVLQLGTSLRPMDLALQRLFRLLLAGGAVGLGLAIVGGALLARQALEPVAQITEAARQIVTTEDLCERVSEPPVHDEIGQLVTTLNEMLDRLQSLFQGQRRFIADVSHELRTPLAAIRGNLEVLERGAQTDPVLLQESLQDVQREVARLSRMVADLLTLGRADAGMHLERRSVELDTLLLQVYREARHLTRGVEVRLGREDQVQVQGDADRLKQLLLNLVDNALKYTPAGGEVTLSLYREGPWACLAVSDTGVGIPRESLPHIFDRFYRGEEKRRRGGMGLGLSIARWIAEQHGGEITVESQVGQGSTFTVWLPRPEREELPGGG